MNTMNEMKINALSSRTFRWLRMNEAVAKDVTVPVTMEYNESLPKEITKKEGDNLTDTLTGAGGEFCEAVKELAFANYTLEADTKASEPIRMDFSFANGCGAGVNFIVKDRADLTVIMDLQSKEDAGDGFLQTKYELGDEAKLTLVQIIRVGEDFRMFNDIGGKEGKDAEVKVIHLFLQGHKIYQGCRTELLGNRSRFDVKAAYNVGKENLLDMTYECKHIGKKTVSDIVAKGVLSGKANKTFRATIDFIKGSSQSTGAELEDALLIDDTVVNRTIPIILCTEEDVEGAHGATIGELDENTMFYLQSRGMDKKAIYDMMTSARIQEVVNQIPDEATVRMLTPVEE
ncbi:MAG: SufD family Fe-S cluster assembly protein [Lachnospiraceae bacterium]|nr:SufD family Fe-S cluster assembly protein [Lachnospiraceae bacterium]